MTVAFEKSRSAVSDAPQTSRIPARHYRCREVVQQEAQQLWPRVWQIACREEHLPNVGDYYEYQIADQSILLVRDVNGAVRGYYNTCLHRGTQLKEGCGNATQLRCPFHAWTWNLDGSIKSVTDAKDFDPGVIEPNCLRLPECLVDICGGFVFINMDNHAESLEASLGVLFDEFDRYRTGSWRIVKAETTILPANWKVAVEAFIEAYHVHSVHPQLLQYWDDTSLVFEPQKLHNIYYPGPPGAIGFPSPRLGDYEIDVRDMLFGLIEEMAALGIYSDEELGAARGLASSIDSIAPGEELRGLLAMMRRAGMEAKGIETGTFSDWEVLDAKGWHLFPNIYMAPAPGGGPLYRARPNGGDPNTCIFDAWQLTEVGSGAAPAPATPTVVPNWKEYDWGRVLTQDFKTMELVQRGLRSRSFEFGMTGRQEVNVANFHRVLAEFLSEE